MVAKNGPPTDKFLATGTKKAPCDLQRAKKVGAIGLEPTTSRM